MENIIFIIFNRINQASQTSFQLATTSSFFVRERTKNLLIGTLLGFLLLFSSALSSLAQPNFDLVGFATQNGGTTGGKGGQTVTVTSFSQLKSYAESSTAYIIMVQGTITNGSSGGQIRVKSNKSIIGMGSTAFLNGVGIDITSQSNIIIQNLKITLVGVSNSGSFNGGDCIGISGSSKNIWIDHCELYSEDPDKQKDIDKYDGLIDIKGQSGFITISWCYFHDHHKGGLVGASDTDLYNDRLITMHHNYYNKVKLRIPMYRGATGHFFNNYIKDASKASEIRAGTCVRMEKNYYDNFSEFAIYTTSDSPGKTERIDNYLSKNQSRAYPANCTANIPYNYSSALTNNVQDVKNIVIQYSGVGKINTPCTPKTWYKDSDGDGKGDPNSTQSSCTQPSGYVADNTDLCPNDKNKSNPEQCGCGVPE
jgi:pectate lyase